MILNFGSINIDLVYRVPHLPRAGETLASTEFAKYLGGKGVNQSIAAAQSGGDVRHIGCVGPDGDWVLEQIAGFGLALDNVARVDAATGHAVICVDDAAENQIILCSGANVAFTKSQIHSALTGAKRDRDWVLCQNETNLVHDVVKQAKMKKLRVAYSAAPFAANHVMPLLDQIDLLAVNEGEAAELEAALGQNPRKLGLPYLLITRGSEGAELWTPEGCIVQQSFKVEPIDTTGAGDTFLGAFMAEMSLSNNPKAALRFAAACSALQVTKAGAAAAIPSRAAVESFLKERGA